MTTIVLLAAMGKAAWPPELLAAMRRHGTVLIADLSLDESLAAMADRVLALASPRFALAAQCMGGFVAFEIMRREPWRVDRLALLNTSARPDGKLQAAHRAARLAALESKAENSTFVDDTYVADAAPWMASQSSLKNPKVRRNIETALRSVPLQALCRQQRAIGRRPDYRPLLKSLPRETLVITGDQDRMTDPVHSLEINDQATSCRFVAYENCGHMTAIERPAAVTAELDRWLAAPPAASA